MILETLLGSLGGGILRMVPEILAWMDRNSARNHELKMQDAAFKFEELRGAQKMREISAQNQMAIDTGGLNALIAGIQAQGKTTGVGWVDAVNATVRPFLTYWWCVCLLTIAKICQFILLYRSNQDMVNTVVQLWGPPEMAIVAGMLNFWFLDRVIRKNNGV